MGFHFPEKKAGEFYKHDDSWRQTAPREVSWTFADGTEASFYVPPWEDAFIEELSLCGSVRHSCLLVGKDRKAVYSHRNYSPSFAQRWELAIADHYDLIWEAALERAVNGVKEPVFFQGQQIGEITKYSDRLLETMLKGTRPQMFRNTPEPPSLADNKPQMFLPEVVEEPLQITPGMPDPIKSNNPEQTHMVDAVLKPPSNGIEGPN